MQVACELFVQLLVARLIRGDGVKRRRQTSDLLALICAQEELVDDATHVRLRLQPTPGLPLAGDAGPRDAAVAAGAGGGIAPSSAIVPMTQPHTLHGHGGRGATRAHRSQRDPEHRTSAFLRGKEGHEL